MVRLFVVLSMAVIGTARADYKEYQFQRMLETGSQGLENKGLFKWLPPFWDVQDDAAST